MIKNKEQTETEEILSRYNYPCDVIVKRIQNASFTDEQENADIINSIVLWKINRQVAIDNSLIMNIHDFSKRVTIVDDIIKNPDNKEQLKSLLNDMLKVKGIRIAMASTILKMFNPDVFPIIDQRAYREATKNVLKVGNVDKDIENYIDYIGKVESCRQEKYPEVKFRDMDALLYQKDKEKGKSVKY